MSCAVPGDGMGFSLTFSAWNCSMRTGMASSGCSTVSAGTPSCALLSRTLRGNRRVIRHLEYPGLLPCNILQSFPQNGDMVYPQSTDSGDNRFRNNVGAIIRSANPNFQDRSVRHGTWQAWVARAHHSDGCSRFGAETVPTSGPHQSTWASSRTGLRLPKFRRRRR